MSFALDGLATGMDTTSIINQLVAVERQPIQRYEEEILELQTTKDAWRDINSRLSNLENKVTPLKLSSTFNSNTANSSNEGVVTATASNGADEAAYSVTVHETAKSQRMFGSQLEGFSAAAKDEITINSTKIGINAGDSLKDISSKINEAEAGVKASIVDNRLVLETSETGEVNALDPADTSSISAQGTILKDLGILGEDVDGNKIIANEAQKATNAEIDINGISGITSATNTFSDTVEDVTFNINPDALVSSETGTAFSAISVTKDTDKAVNAVQGFVDQYNSVMNFVDGKTDYDEEQEKAQILQGDSTAMRLQMKLRTMVTSKVKDSGELKTLSSVGIEIDRDGVMSFDSAKFKEAFNETPDEVSDIFRASSDTDGFDGMAQRMDGYLDQLMQTNSGLIPRRLDFFDNRISSLNEDIEDVERKVELTRDRYVEQFAAMESAISDMNQQMSWMESQLSSMSVNTQSQSK
ncbi:flagellar filament capping protein FliD [Halanaerobium sp.]|uniref:flagellar filament capping protein FliD n=1 Tax=Halanaerobium sp. TaxID=1895664 RepID=UPI000DE6CDAD|nr:flagellar filament capping protein FliD [Halanaerobium sp.]PUU88177.1 MAG: flagellar hook-associated protein 2 [Halanaerobium sp.]